MKPARGALSLSRASAICVFVSSRKEDVQYVAMLAGGGL